MKLFCFFLVLFCFFPCKIQRKGKGQQAHRCGDFLELKCKNIFWEEKNRKMTQTFSWMEGSNWKQTESWYVWGAWQLTWLCCRNGPMPMQTCKQSFWATSQSFHHISFHNWESSASTVRNLGILSSRTALGVWMAPSPEGAGSALADGQTLFIQKFYTHLLITDPHILKITYWIENMF